jgi:hypothetical protein
MDFLLKTQRNQLFKAVVDSGFSPSDFIQMEYPPFGGRVGSGPLMPPPVDVRR